MDKFRSVKQNSVDSKTRAGSRPTARLKSSTFLPSIFRSPINQKWLDATLDNMISKGDLERFDGFVGEYDSLTAENVDDVYVNTGFKKQLTPSIISTNEDGTLADVIDFNNILNHISFNFADTGYNLNKAYSANRFVYNPPIDIDMFINYQQYYWCFNLPVLELDIDSQVDALEGRPYGSITYTDAEGTEKSIDIFNGMRVKFSDGIEYVIGGVGYSVKFLTHNPSDFDDNGKDYILIERSDISNTYWSTYNFWFHHKALLDLSLHIPSMDISLFKNKENQAYRPIIQFIPGMELMSGQTKTSLNQEPLFRLVDQDGYYLDTYPGSSFVGNKIFAYKKGTGRKDPELGFALSYETVGHRSEYIFENCIEKEIYVYDTEFSSFTNDIKGNLFFVHNGRMKSVYTRSPYGFGVKTKNSYILSDEEVENGITIPLGWSDWRVEKEIVVTGHSYETATEKTTTDKYNLCFEDQTDIVMGVGVTRTFRDLTAHGNLRFWDFDSSNNLIDVEDPIYSGNITVSRVDNVIEVTNNGEVGSYFYYGNGYHGLNKIFMIDSSAQDEYFHTITLDGKQLLKDACHVNENDMHIHTDLMKSGSMIDVEYYDVKSDISRSSEVPDVLKSNSTNRKIEEFTISDTIAHWDSILASVPNLRGDQIGSNNYYKLQKTITFGGTISITDENPIMHDACYSNSETNITQALYEQGRDWWSFRKRFMNQLYRNYKTKIFDNSRDLVNFTLDGFKNTKTNNIIHSDSNMVFSDTTTDRYFDYPELGFVVIPEGFKKDYFKSDHIYVYLTHNKENNNSPITELLINGVDYTIDASTINLIKQPTPFTFSQIKEQIIVSHHNHYDKSYVPASLAKLGLSNVYQPTIRDGKLYCHDGFVVDLENENVELYNTKSQYYNPSIAGLWELENRIYNNLLKIEAESVFNYIDTTQIDTVDSHVEYFFIDYLRKNNITDINEGLEFDANDPWTWNYSTVSHTGYWYGCYVYNFRTTTPHITPWHMFGYAHKPIWWDIFYSWTDAYKRSNLIYALKYSTRNDLYKWDWDNKCPVDENGELVSPELILGTPIVSDAAVEFKFGDWSPVETQFRLGPIGQSVMLDAVLKLNPSKVWNRVFNVDTFNSSSPKTSFMDGEIVSPSSSLVHGHGKGKKVKEVKVVSSLDNFDQYGNLEFFFVSDEYIKHAVLEADISDGTVHNININGSGSGYETVPNIVIVGDYTNPDDGSITRMALGGVDYTVVMEDNKQWVAGITHIQQNYMVRNQFQKNMGVFYKSLHTRLTQNLNGFSSQHLINVSAETGSVGRFSLGFNDFELILNTDAPDELIVASSIEIEKTDSGYIVNGYSKHKQTFKFFRPIGRNSNDYKVIELNTTSTVRKYNSFSSEISYIPFGYKFARIQDVYDFVRGYYEYLTKSGFVFDEDGDSKALAFAQWAVTADINTEYRVSIGTSLSFDSEFGVVQKFGEVPGGYNSILVMDEYGNIVDIEYSDLCITRRGTEVLVNPRVRQIDVQGDSIVQVTTENFETHKSTETQYQEYQAQNTVSMTGKSGEIVSAAVSVIYFDHYIVINNATKFAEDIFDDVYGLMHRRLLISGEKTRNWNGSTVAPGYLVNDNAIVQNFDSLVSDSADFYDLNVAKFNKDIQEVERMTLGFISPEWVKSLGLDSNTKNKFYQGLIKRRGTRDAIDRVGRSNLINGGNSDIHVNEEWMFINSYYGDTTRTYSTEIRITNDDVENGSLLLDLDSPSINFVNNENIPTFKTVDIATFESNLDRFHTAGSPKIGESDFTVTDVDEFTSLDITQYDFAKIPSWSGETEYFRGDIVRKDGLLLSCNVDIIPYVRESENITLTKAVENTLQVPHGHSMTIDGIAINFDKFRPNYQDIIVTGLEYGEPGVSGIVDETNLVAHNDFLSINGIGLNFQIIESVKQIKAINPFIALSYVPTSDPVDVTGKTFTINNTTLNLEDHGTLVVNTPSDKNEVFTSAGIPDPVDPINNPPTAQDTFTIVETLSPTTWSIASVTVAGSPATFTKSGQDITITSGISIGDTVVVTLTHVALSDSYTMTEAQFATMIEGVDTKFTVNQLNNQIIYVPTTLDQGIVIPDPLPEFGVPSANLIAENVTTAYEFTDQIADPFTQAQLPLIAQQINDAISNHGDLSGVTASGGPLVASVSSDGKRIIITENVDPINNSNISVSYGIVFTGTAAEKLGLSYTQITFDESTPIPTFSNIDDVSTFINDANIYGVNSYYVNGIFSIISENSLITIEDSDFTSLIGLQTGVFSSPTGLTENVFNINQWLDITNQDEALSSFWIINDGKLGNAVSNGITNKFFGWNFQKFQQTGARAEIVKGSETDRGNDAVVRLYNTQNQEQNHYLEIGDYVMFLNTTTVPSTVGIHKVTDTQVSTTGFSFTIDKYIDTDGIAEGVFVLRNRRFKTNLEFENSKSKPSIYSYIDGELVFVDENNNGVKSSVVYKYHNTSDYKFSNSTGTFLGEFRVLRELSKRVVNERIESVIIYDAYSNQTIADLEVFDPLREIIPGVARKEIDFVSSVDLAIYSESTDEDVTLDKTNSWGEAEVGTVWWDTRTVNYIDYEQGDDTYRVQHWGEQVIGSSIDVYEWTKSSVPPQDWAEKVTAKSNEFGFEASGEAFVLYDKETDTYDYYYTEEFEYNSTFNRYDSVYYFWVKNKTSSSDEDRSITVTEIASIINDPSANGIAWCAATSDSSFIARGIDRYLNDESTILQVNIKPEGIDHENWTVIAENKDLIPDYWYVGLEDNLIGAQRVTGNPLPSRELNEFNRYGDNRNLKFNSKYYSQAWFMDVWDARKEAIFIINRLLKNQNLLMERNDTWWRIITTVWHDVPKHADIGIEPNPSVLFPYPTKGQVYYNELLNEQWHWDGSEWVKSPGYDMRRTWDWDDYINENYDVTSDASINVYTKEELESVDKTQHEIVRFVKTYDNISRDEIYLLVDGEWVLIRKINGTIQFNDIVWNKYKQIGWDTKPWEGIWDFDVGYFMGLIIKACREDLFIGQDIVNFNKLFFGMIKYVASLYDQVDWFYKTTYIRLDVETIIHHNVIDRPNKYRKSGIDSLISYTNTVKPYHTKLRTFVDNNKAYEDVPVTMTEQSIKKTIRIDLPRISEDEEKSMFDYVYVDDFDTITSTFGDDLEALEPVDFTTEPEDEWVEPEFNFVSNLNDFGTYRRYMFNTTIDEDLQIVIDNDGEDSILYVQDNNSMINVFRINQDGTRTPIKFDPDVRDTRGNYHTL